MVERPLLWTPARGAALALIGACLGVFACQPPQRTKTISGWADPPGGYGSPGAGAYNGPTFGSTGAGPTGGGYTGPTSFPTGSTSAPATSSTAPATSSTAPAGSATAIATLGKPGHDDDPHFGFCATPKGNGPRSTFVSRVDGSVANGKDALDALASPFRVCYDTLKSAKPMCGTMELTANIGANGRPTHVELTNDSPIHGDVIDCCMAKLMAVKMAAPTGGSAKAIVRADFEVLP